MSKFYELRDAAYREYDKNGHVMTPEIEVWLKGCWCEECFFCFRGGIGEPYCNHIQFTRPGYVFKGASHGCYSLPCHIARVDSFCPWHATQVEMHEVFESKEYQEEIVEREKLRYRAWKKKLASKSKLDDLRDRFASHM